MAGVPPLSTVDSILKDLKKSRKELVKLANALPDEDAFATPYSILSDMIRNIDEFIGEIKIALKEAKDFRKQNPDQFPNRARKWCSIDSRRKQSPRT